jgi:hypothetical protein
LPNGKFEMIGDTSGGQAPWKPGTDMEYAATRGASGVKPARVIAKYTAGYLFARSGWGEKRPAADETFLSTKWGAAPVFHGHSDGLELTLAGYGSRLLIDPGLYAYSAGTIRGFMKGRSAHNVVTVDGLTWHSTATSRLLAYHVSSKYVDIQLRAAGYTGVTHTRRITYSRGLDYVIVDDQLASSSTHTYRQLWHFTEDAKPAVGVASVWTQRAKGNVMVRQLAGTTTMNIVRGRTSPVQGWVSYTYGVKVAAPVEEAVKRGSNVRYVTLIVPAAGHPNPKVSGFHLTSTGYTVTIAIGAHSERLTVSGTSIWLTPLS